MFAITWILLAIYLQKVRQQYSEVLAFIEISIFWLVLASISEEEVQKTCRKLDPKCNFEYSLISENVEDININNKKVLA